MNGCLHCDISADLGRTCNRCWSLQLTMERAPIDALRSIMMTIETEYVTGYAESQRGKKARKDFARWRTLNGLSLRAAADHLDIDHTWLFRFESGQRAPSLGLAVILGEQCGIPINSLLPATVWGHVKRLAALM